MTGGSTEAHVAYCDYCYRSIPIDDYLRHLRILLKTGQCPPASQLKANSAGEAGG